MRDGRTGGFSCVLDRLLRPHDPHQAERERERERGAVRAFGWALRGRRRRRRRPPSSSAFVLTQHPISPKLNIKQETKNRASPCTTLCRRSRPSSSARAVVAAAGRARAGPQGRASRREAIGSCVALRFVFAGVVPACFVARNLSKELPFNTISQTACNTTQTYTRTRQRQAHALCAFSIPARARARSKQKTLLSPISSSSSSQKKLPRPFAARPGASSPRRPAHRAL